jgi:hypothetical protein
LSIGFVPLAPNNSIIKLLATQFLPKKTHLLQKSNLFFLEFATTINAILVLRIKLHQAIHITLHYLAKNLFVKL